MSLQTPSTYNPEAIVLILDGVPIDGFADDGIDINQEEASELTLGMDSGVTFEYDPSRVARVTVTLRAASAGAKRMAAIQASVVASLRASGPHPNIAGTAADPVNGSFVTSPTVFFLNKPLASFQKQSGTVEYQLAFINYEDALAPSL